MGLFGREGSKGATLDRNVSCVGVHNHNIKIKVKVKVKVIV